MFIIKAGEKVSTWLENQHDLASVFIIINIISNLNNIIYEKVCYVVLFFYVIKPEINYRHWSQWLIEDPTTTLFPYYNGCQFYGVYDQSTDTSAC